MMKRALFGIASVGILAVTVGVETADALSYRRYGPARAYSSQPYTPQSRGSVRRGGVPGNAPGYSNSDSPQPRAVVALATIKISGTGETKKTLAGRAKRFGMPRRWQSSAPTMSPASPASGSPSTA